MSELLKVVTEYKRVTGYFPGNNDYWWPKFEKAYLYDLQAEPSANAGSSVDGSGGKGWTKNEHDTLTVAEEKIKDLEERLKTERENHNNLFYYWNDKFPDEMREYLNCVSNLEDKKCLDANTSLVK